MSGACGTPALASDTYGKTLATMDSLRDTLRDEHTCLLQVPTWHMLPPSVMSLGFSVPLGLGEPYANSKLRGNSKPY